MLQTLELGPTDIWTAPLPAEVFRPFENLTSLILTCIYQHEIPSASFKFLPNLERLSFAMTGRVELGHEFLALTNLKSLYIFHRDLIIPPPEITRRTFAVLPQLKELRLLQKHLILHADFLKAFRNLTALSMSCSKSRNKISDIISAIKQQEYPTLEKLILDSTFGDGELSFDSDLFNSTNFAKITHLNMRNSRITSWDWTALYNLPNLRSIALGANTIMVDNYQKGIHGFLEKIKHMNIDSIDVNYLNTKIINTRRLDCSINHSLQDLFQKPPKIIQSLKASSSINQAISNDKSVLNTPPSLLYIYASHVDFTLLFDFSHKQSIEFSLDNNILYIDISFGNFDGNLPLLMGLSKLQGIDISNIGLKHISLHQLAHLPSLTYLSAHHNNLQNIDLPTFMAKGAALKWLDLGYNYFENIPRHTFINQISTEHLSLQGNPLLSVMLDLQPNTKLKFLDISSCALVTLPDPFLRQLDRLQSKLDQDFSLNISNNMFQCSCDTLNMILWFNTTKVNIIDREHILCTFDNETMSVVDVDYNTMAKTCQRASPGHLSLVSLSLSVVIPMAIIVLVITLCYRFRWHLRWHVYRLRRFLRRFLRRIFQVQGGPGTVPQYPAFVSYNHQEDYEWVENVLCPVVEEHWQLELCIGHRNFIAGKPIVDNIMDAIDNSQRTILVVTPAFARSEWCEFEMQMALTRGQHRIVIIYKEEVSDTDMSKTLQALMKSITYIEYDPQDDVLFWQRLHKYLTQHPER